MELLKIHSMYKEWVEKNPEVLEIDKIIARTLLATNDISMTLFITGASFEEVTEVYNRLGSPFSTNRSFMSEGRESNAGYFTSRTSRSDEGNKIKRRINRKKAVSFVLNKIIVANEVSEVIKVHYNTLELKLTNKKVVKIKISTSKDYNEIYCYPNKICCSWHKENEKQVTNFDYHIYTTEFGNTYKGLIFTTNELLDLLKKKSYKNNFVSYYFHWNSNGSVTDERDTLVPINITSNDADNTNWQLEY